MIAASSTLTRPAEHMIQRFRPSMAGTDSIRTYLEKGWSLAICCKGCPRLVEWTPYELNHRFGDNLDLRITHLIERLSCAGEGGCGSQEVAVFPHLYDGNWTWPPAAAVH